MSVDALDAAIAARGGAAAVTACAVAQLPPDMPEPPLEAYDEIFREAARGDDRGPERTRTFKLLSVADVRALRRPPDLVHGVMPAQGCGALYGPSGSGKSFLVIDLMAAVAGAQEWFGHKVRNGRVVYVMLEGTAGLGKRVKAWEVANDCSYPDRVSFLIEPFNLLDRDDVLGLASAVQASGGADLVVIDTLNRATPGTDENGPEDSGRILAAMQAIQEMTGGFILVCHHTGKDASKGMRGHSSLFAGMDAVVATSRTGDARDWTNEKEKDDRDGQTHPFRLKVIEVGEDDDGDPVTSCVVEQPGADDPVSTIPRPRPPKGGNQRIVYDALGLLFRESNAFGKAGAPPIRPCIELEAAVLSVRERLTVDPKRKTERARQALAGLVASGVLGSNEGWLWLI